MLTVLTVDDTRRLVMWGFKLGVTTALALCGLIMFGVAPSPWTRYRAVLALVFVVAIADAFRRLRPIAVVRALRAA